MKRCHWCIGNDLNQTYHDEEWGVPVHNDQKHFEFLTMEVMQCGLNWLMMLKKRGVKYMGSITVYSHLQACGIINDHDKACWMYEKLIQENPTHFID